MSSIKMYKNGNATYTLDSWDDVPESVEQLICDISNNIDFNGTIFGIDSWSYDITIAVDNWVSNTVVDWSFSDKDLETLADTRRLHITSQLWEPDCTYHKCSNEYLRPWELDFRAKHMERIPREYGMRGNRGGYRFDHKGMLELWSYDTCILRGEKQENGTYVFTLEWEGYSDTTSNHINAFIRMVTARHGKCYIKTQDGDLLELWVMSRREWFRLCALCRQWD